MRLGVHVSIAGGVYKAFERGADIGCRTIQIFTKNGNRWQAKPLTHESVEAFRDSQEKTGIWPVLAHASYLINLASPDNRLYQRSLAALVQEMERAEMLGVSVLVLHPGSHVGSGEEVGIVRVAQGLTAICRRCEDMDVVIALETTAGQGSQLGYRFEHLARILEQVDGRDRVKICLDSCHMYASGYDISTAVGFVETMEKFHRLIGLDRLAVIHLNDSKTECGARKDRHEHIGQGCLGLETFRRFLRDESLTELPCILETPKGKNSRGEDWDAVNLRTLRNML